MSNAPLQLILSSAPARPGVYKMLGQGNTILYIGKAKDLKNRLTSYTRVNELPERIVVMISQVVLVEIVITESEVDALLLEAQLIKALKPKYNILLKDGKSHPYIAISKHQYPRLSKHRGVLTASNEYYGPFIAAKTVDSTLLALHKAFLLRSCSDAFFASRQRPCMEYQIKRCSAPCTNKIAESDYAKAVKLARNTLVGKSKEVQKSLYDAMTRTSAAQDYEHAAIYRDRLKALQQIQEQTITSSIVGNADIIGIVKDARECCIHVASFRQNYCCGNQSHFIPDVFWLSEGEILTTFLAQLYKSDIPHKIHLSHQLADKEVMEMALTKLAGYKVTILTTEHERLVRMSVINAQEALQKKQQDSEKIRGNLKELTSVFHLSQIPERIEVYDNSHISGSHAVGVMIVCNKYGFLKSEYKKFSIRSNIIGDDYAMMREVISRRFSGKIKDIIPDFILIDGGPGHLSAVIEVMDEMKLEIPVACIAKGRDRNAGNEDFFVINRRPFNLGQDSQLLLYLQSIRNEAHRFAITTHRKKRNKALTISRLDKIPGIGLQRRKNLLAYFGSVQAIKNASVDDISKVSGISNSLAVVIKQHLTTDVLYDA